MAHGERASKKSNKQGEYWSPRPGNFAGPPKNRWTKTRTHRLERRENKGKINESEQ